MDITFTIFLFGIVFSFFCWLITPITQPQTSTIQQPLPIEQQFKQVLQEIDAEELDSLPTKVVLEPAPQPLTIIKPNPVEKTDSTSTADIPPTIDLTQINLKQARQIAKTLGITQTVKGKAKPKALLIKQIQQNINQQNITAISKLLTA